MQLFTSTAGRGVGEGGGVVRGGDGPVGWGDPGQCGLPQGVL